MHVFVSKQILMFTGARLIESVCQKHFEELLQLPRLIHSMGLRIQMLSKHFRVIQRIAEENRQNSSLRSMLDTEFFLVSL